MTRIRVLHLVTGIAIGEQSGGAEQIALQIALRLDRAVFEPAVFIMRRYNSLTETIWQRRLVEAQVSIYGFEAHGGTLDDLAKVWRELWHCVGTFGPDIVNSHSERGDALNVASHLLHPDHPHAVRTMHTDRQWQTRPWTGRFLQQAVFPLACAGEVAVSQAVRAELDRRPLARLLGKRATLSYAAIDVANFRRRAPQTTADNQPGADAANDGLLAGDDVLPPGIPRERPRIGIIGRLAPQKGHTFLLPAMAQLSKERSVSLLVIGAGDLDSDLKAQAATLGIADRVHFLGSRRDVAEILPHLDLLVSASLWEGLPGVILEAMAAGVPIIATDVSGSREVVIQGQTGILAPPGRADALAAAIAQALDQPAMMRAMAQRASRYVEQFTIERMVAGYAALYQKTARR